MSEACKNIMRLKSVGLRTAGRARSKTEWRHKTSRIPGRKVKHPERKMVSAVASALVMMVGAAAHGEGLLIAETVTLPDDKPRPSGLGGCQQDRTFCSRRLGTSRVQRRGRSPRPSAALEDGHGDCAPQAQLFPGVCVVRANLLNP
jgi:hypothetical protein